MSQAGDAHVPCTEAGNSALGAIGVTETQTEKGPATPSRRSDSEMQGKQGEGDPSDHLCPCYSPVTL